MAGGLLCESLPAAVPQDDALQTLLSVSEKHPGDAAVADAWRQVAGWDMNRLADVMNALDQAHPVARNWLRSAIDGMLEQPGRELPVAALQRMVEDTARGLPSRRVAMELLESSDPNLVESLIPNFLHDPAAEFRRPAVAKLIAEANKLQQQPEEHKALLWTAFHAARAEDQVLSIAKALEGMGETVDITEHFGFIRTWHIVGPFENKEMAGFDRVYPPETLTSDDFDDRGQPAADATFAGLEGPVRWRAAPVKPTTGEVDLNEALGKLKGVLAYGATVFHSDTARPAELRLRLQNPFKIWVNGKLVMSQRIGHTGNSFDQYKVLVELVAGANVIVVKSVQPEPPQENEWYDAWHWSVRVCDSTGTAIQEGKK